MAAFYFDYILIQYAGDDKYTFSAFSNPGIGVRQAATAVPRLAHKKLIYTLPDPSIGNNEMKFPETTIDFKDYTTYDAIHIGIEYPEYDDIKDMKGEFCIKDTDYPPPAKTGSHFENFSSYKSVFDQKIQSFTGIITQRFKFNRIELKRIIDQTYTIEIELKDPGATIEYVPVSYTYEHDDYRKCDVLVLAVKKDKPNAYSTMLFKKSDLLINMENQFIPILIYDVNNGDVKDIPWKLVDDKNAHLAFD